MTEIPFIFILTARMIQTGIVSRFYGQYRFIMHQKKTPAPLPVAILPDC
jgi:hypothetical protein